MEKVVEARQCDYQPGKVKDKPANKSSYGFDQHPGKPHTSGKSEQEPPRPRAPALGECAGLTVKSPVLMGKERGAADFTRTSRYLGG